jgi:LuxR family maltose regulon positive regulatory protein
VQQPYLNYGDCFAYSACGLALIHQLQGRPDEARAVIEAASAFMVETGNTTLMQVIQAFQAEIVLRQGQIATASQWATHLDPIPPLTPMVELFAPHLTLVKVWLAQDTSASRGQAADLLGEFRQFAESTHNTRFLIEALALQALIYHTEGDEPSALAALEQAIALAEPGGFIRLFVDLGPPMARLLAELHRLDVAREYIAQILAAFGTKDDADADIADAKSSSLVVGPSSSPVLSKAEGLIEPLTPRELEVLALLNRHLTNQEIAEELVVSPSTVKTHTLNIYRKLEVHGRKQAVAKAKELHILPPNVM